MPTTTPDNLSYPGGGEGYDLIVDWGASMTSVQTALTLKANYGVGTTAQMNAAVAKFPNGAIWYNTTDSKEYRRVSGSWVALDTGTVDLSSYLLSGITGSLYGRVVRNGVEVYGDVNGTFNSGNTVTDIASGIPAQFRSPGLTRLGSVYSGAFAGSAVVRSDGTVGIANRTGTNWSTALFNVAFLK